MLSILVSEEPLLAVSVPIVTRGWPHHTSPARESRLTIADSRCVVRETGVHRLARSVFLAKRTQRDSLLECPSAMGMNKAPSATLWRRRSERGARLPSPTAALPGVLLFLLAFDLDGLGLGLYHPWEGHREHSVLEAGFRLVRIYALGQANGPSTRAPSTGARQSLRPGETKLSSKRWLTASLKVMKSRKGSQRTMLIARLIPSSRCLILIVQKRSDCLLSS